MRDDGPGPQPVKMQLHRMGLGPRLLQRVDRPHRQIRHQQKRHDLPAGFPSNLLSRSHRSPRRVEYENCLKGRLHDARQRCDKHEYRVLLEGEVTADHREHRVDEHAGLRCHEEDVVQLKVAGTVETQLSHLAHAD